MPIHIQSVLNISSHSVLLIGPDTAPKNYLPYKSVDYFFFGTKASDLGHTDNTFVEQD